jgi:hypothetical protein
MATNREAKGKIAAAAKGCGAAETAWQHANAALAGSVRTNCYDVHHNRYELRDKLILAQAHIQEALRALDGIAWPTNADYDAAE